MTVGKNYASDMWDYDVYKAMENYEKKVLILHGNRDGIVDVSYSEQAAENYPDAELHV
jgi:pimeloyl-ACP methyl ester carboxylesterase